MAFRSGAAPLAHVTVSREVDVVDVTELAVENSLDMSEIVCMRHDTDVGSSYEKDASGSGTQCVGIDLICYELVENDCMHASTSRYDTSYTEIDEKEGKVEDWIPNEIEEIGGIDQTQTVKSLNAQSIMSSVGVHVGLGKVHEQEHIQIYGEGNDRHLIGAHETAAIDSNGIEQLELSSMHPLEDACDRGGEMCVVSQGQRTYSRHGSGAGIDLHGDGENGGAQFVHRRGRWRDKRRGREQEYKSIFHVDNGEDTGEGGLVPGGVRQAGGADNSVAQQSEAVSLEEFPEIIDPNEQEHWSWTNGAGAAWRDGERLPQKPAAARHRTFSRKQRREARLHARWPDGSVDYRTETDKQVKDQVIVKDFVAPLPITAKFYASPFGRPPGSAWSSAEIIVGSTVCSMFSEEVCYEILPRVLFIANAAEASNEGCGHDVQPREVSKPAATKIVSSGTQTVADAPGRFPGGERAVVVYDIVRCDVAIHLSFGFHSTPEDISATVIADRCVSGGAQTFAKYIVTSCVQASMRCQNCVAWSKLFWEQHEAATVLQQSVREPLEGTRTSIILNHDLAKHVAEGADVYSKGSELHRQFCSTGQRLKIVVNMFGDVGDLSAEGSGSSASASASTDVFGAVGSSGVAAAQRVQALDAPASSQVPARAALPDDGHVNKPCEATKLAVVEIGSSGPSASASVGVFGATRSSGVAADLEVGVPWALIVQGRADLDTLVKIGACPMRFRSGETFALIEVASKQEALQTRDCLLKLGYAVRAHQSNRAGAGNNSKGVVDSIDGEESPVHEADKCRPVLSSKNVGFAGMLCAVDKGGGDQKVVKPKTSKGVTATRPVHDRGAKDIGEWDEEEEWCEPTPQEHWHTHHVWHHAPEEQGHCEEE